MTDAFFPCPPSFLLALPLPKPRHKDIQEWWSRSPRMPEGEEGGSMPGIPWGWGGKGCITHRPWGEKVSQEQELTELFPLQGAFSSSSLFINDVTKSIIKADFIAISKSVSEGHILKKQCRTRNRRWVRFELCHSESPSVHKLPWQGSVL